MELPDGRPLVVDDGVLTEAASGDGRLVLWIPGARVGGFRHWDRLGTAAGATVTCLEGIRSVAAVLTPARQRTGLALPSVLRRLVSAKAEPSWDLPGGGTCERSGPRRTDLALVWSDDEAVPLDEKRIRERWPQCLAVRRIGPGLHLASGVDSGRMEGKPAPPEDLPPAIPGRQLAEEALGLARQSGDLSREVTALIDLAITYLNKLEGQPAVPLLEEALAGARRLGDRPREADALSNLAQASLLLRQPRAAIEMLEPTGAYLREVGDAYAEKVVLERLGHARRALGEHTRALAAFEHASRMAHDLGDAQHEAQLLWHASIELAELGQREPAIARASAAVDVLRRLKKPEADRYAQQLASYRFGSPARASGGAAVLSEGSITTNVFAAPTIKAAPEETPAAGPGVLRMALNVAKSAARFAGSGFKTVTPEVYRARLAVCSTCAQYTGLRCRVCGCITPAKARLPQEDCPVGKWPR